MATIVLQAAGAFIGGALGPIGSAVGSAAGALAGYVVDRSLIASTRHYEGPRLSAARPFTAEEGAPIPRVYGTMRVGGTLIWATRFEEESTTSRQGGKGGPKTTTYSYFANAAFALCEGEIAGVRRIWADGREVDRERVDIRVYNGTEDQGTDPLIEAKQGEGNAPSYRGTAYVVIERFQIDDYGRRLPQFQFEVLRPAGALNGQIGSVALIPGATEYGLCSELVTVMREPGETNAVNRHVLTAATDLEASLDELQMLCPNLETVALVVSWFGDDLRADRCRFRPMVAQNVVSAYSKPWRVSGLGRDTAPVVSQVDGGAAYGGTPSDNTVVEAISEIRARGLKVVLYPFVMMDVPADNTLADPYGRDKQPPYPWRGRITCHPAPGRAGTPDKTSALPAVVEAVSGDARPGDFAPGEETIAFSGAADDWGYRRFVLHHAHLAAMAGGVDGFLIGSELRSLTTLRDEDNRFPFVEVLKDIAGDVRTLLGSGTRISYGADWSEYFGHQPADGSGDVFFHLDGLWAHDAIDAVGIDNYMPLSDWRDADYAGGNPDGFAGPYDAEGLRAMVAGGEGHDWYYASASARDARDRSPIGDGAYGKDWVFRYKDLVAWWSNPHFDRPGGVEAGTATQWTPRSKPIWITELGCPAVDKGPNQPNVFPDPKSAEDAIPYFSNGGRCDLAPRRFLAAHYAHWRSGAAVNPVSDVYGGPMIDPSDICLWSWDARAFPAFPLRADDWSDGPNWTRGHWLNGRANAVAVGDLVNAILADHGLPEARTEMADGVVQGFLIAEPTTARAPLEQLMEIFGLVAREEPGGLVFETEGRSRDGAIVIENYVLEDDAAAITRTRIPGNDLPAGAQLTFRDLLDEHQSASAETRRATGLEGGNDTSFLSFSGVLAPGQAQGLIADWLHRQWAGRDRLAFAMPMTGLAVRPGSLVRLGAPAGPSDYLVTEVEEGAMRAVKARRITRMPPTIWMPETFAAGASAASAKRFVAGRPLAMLLDLPTRTASDRPEEQLRIAARAKPWRRQVAFVSPESTGFAQRNSIERRAVTGRLVDALAGGFEGRIDFATTLTVALFDGELSSVSRGRLLNGANAAAVGTAGGAWEIVQFREAEEIEPSVWRLSGLLRGQLGTNDAMMAGSEAGAAFVLLDEAVGPAGLRASEIGLALNWRVGPAGYDLSSANFAQIEATGGVRAQLPLSPVHLRGRMADNGDLAISWIRRGRIDADSWMGEEIPLGEAEERYRVAIVAAGGGVVRTVTVDAPRLTYTAADIAEDFDGVPAAMEITVSQMSGAVGAGVAATRTIALA